MANIKFSGLVSEITGKLNGSVLQRIKGGFVIKNKNYGKTGNSQINQYARSYFTLAAKSWAHLTNVQRDGWNNAVLLGSSGYQLFIKLNSLRSLLGLDLVYDYNGSTPPTLLSGLRLFMVRSDVYLFHPSPTFWRDEKVITFFSWLIPNVYSRRELKGRYIPTYAVDSRFCYVGNMFYKYWGKNLVVGDKVQVQWNSTDLHNGLIVAKQAVNLEVETLPYVDFRSEKTQFYYSIVNVAPLNLGGRAIVGTNPDDEYSIGSNSSVCFDTATNPLLTFIPTEIISFYLSGDATALFDGLAVGYTLHTDLLGRLNPQRISYYRGQMLVGSVFSQNKTTIAFRANFLDDTTQTIFGNTDSNTKNKIAFYNTEGSKYLSITTDLGYTMQINYEWQTGWHNYIVFKDELGLLLMVDGEVVGTCGSEAGVVDVNQLFGSWRESGSNSNMLIEKIIVYGELTTNISLSDFNNFLNFVPTN